MFNWFRRKKKNVDNETAAPTLDGPAAEGAVEAEPQEPQSGSVPAGPGAEELAGEPENSEARDEAAEKAAEEPESSAEAPEPADAVEEAPAASAAGEAEDSGGGSAGSENPSASGETAERGEDDEPQEPSAEERQGLLARFRQRLASTRSRLAGRLETLLSSVRSLDDDLLDDLEELLITADLGVSTTTDLLFKIRGQVASRDLKDAEALKGALKKCILEMVNLPIPPQPQAKPLVLMVVGINGVGKTTSIAKLTKRFIDNGQKVLLAAGDTFRSAAVEQLSIWAERLGADIVSQPTGADAAAVVFDALIAAKARGVDVVLIDTAGRLHTKANLMDELKKIKRVANKALPGAPHHSILVLDGNTGQNALSQAKTFDEAIGVDSIIVTKLDGTAKGGVLVSIAHELKIPIAFVGLGESFEDLQSFDAEAFTEAIVG